MVNLTKSALFLALIFAQDAVLAAKILPRDYERFTNNAVLEGSKTLDVRADENRFLNIVQGLLRSSKNENIVKYITDIPCEAINTLETDAHAAKKFVRQLKHGQVPSIIQNLPQEAIQEFRNIIKIAYTLPTEILTAAEAAATDAARVFDDIEDGHIIKDIENIPDVVVSDITSGWGDLTSDLASAWDEATSEIGCFFAGDCTQPTAVGTCGAAAAATTTSDATGNRATATNYDAARPTGSTSSASTKRIWTGPGVLMAAAVAVFACALLYL